MLPECHPKLERSRQGPPCLRDPGDPSYYQATANQLRVELHQHLDHAERQCSNDDPETSEDVEVIPQRARGKVREQGGLIRARVIGSVPTGWRVELRDGSRVIVRRDAIRRDSAGRDARSRAEAAFVRERFPLVVIPCSSQKLDVPARARSLYQGPLFRSALKAAERVWARRTLVLSARHGLLELDDIVAPYDLKLGDDDAVGSQVVARQAKHLGEGTTTPFVVLLLPASYSSLALSVWRHAVTPLWGSAGIGDQRRRLALLGPSQLGVGLPSHVRSGIPRDD